MLYLTKSDFKAASDCPAKLYYRKERYPSTESDNPYLEFLADGGYMVEAIAKLMFPSGREMGFATTADAVRETQTAISQENVVLFEATLTWQGLLARVDILEKTGNSFRLIEVKAKSFDSTVVEGPTPFRGKRGAISAEWIPYLEDVTFQVNVIRNLFPGAHVEPFLCLVDKSKTTTVDAIFKQFEFTPRSGHPGSVPQVRFVGDVEALRINPFVSLVSVSSEVEELFPEVRERSSFLAGSLAGTRAQKLPTLIGRKCAKCEYRTDSIDRNGFRECWGALADPSPLILDLYQLQTLGTKGSVAERMITEGRTAILDIDPSNFTGANGVRQRLQFEATRTSKEFRDPLLAETLVAKPYPLHFVDFETSGVAVPFHAGMRPYEVAAFQWSCHTIRAPGGPIEHSEWLNSEDAFPNFSFARALRDTIGTKGTVYIWSPHEVTILREIRRQMDRYGEHDPALANWLDSFASDASPICDLMKLAKEFYFHPSMLGRLSIKCVLPAVWQQNQFIRHRAEFSRYYREEGGRILNPYQTLPNLPFGDDEFDGTLAAVAEGTGAMRTYQEMMYGPRRTDLEFFAASRRLLLNYCELDTAAMVIIWLHWSGSA
ncbi:MAG: DUF2779 domain-containing protein [Armatimonadetes bacterium]|nr:DUF2779 domain-containing protein [Akkermansiaceae bacterium]